MKIPWARHDIEGAAVSRPEPGEAGIKTFRITARKHPNGTWEIDCPEWKYCRAVKNLTKELAMLSAEIETTLEENENGLSQTSDY